MKHDIKLRNYIILITILSIIILFLLIVGPSFIDISIRNKFVISIVDFVIIMVSGIFGSSFVLWINKIFDYNSKKKDKLQDFHYWCFEYWKIFGTLNPIWSNNGNYENYIKQYEIFDTNDTIFNNIIRLYETLYFSKKDDCKEDVDKLKELIVKYTTVIKNNKIYIKYNKHEDELTIRQYLEKSNEILFEKIINSDNVTYYSVLKNDFEKHFNNLGRKVLDHPVEKITVFPKAIIKK